MLVQPLSAGLLYDERLQSFLDLLDPPDGMSMLASVAVDPEAQLLQSLGADSGVRWFFALESRRVAGCAALRFHDRLPLYSVSDERITQLHSVWELSSLYVSPAARGLGCANLLTEARLGFLRELARSGCIQSVIRPRARYSNGAPESWARNASAWRGGVPKVDGITEDLVGPLPCGNASIADDALAVRRLAEAHGFSSVGLDPYDNGYVFMREIHARKVGLRASQLQEVPA